MSTQYAHPTLRAMRGMSMVELLVALTIGSFLMWGAISVYSRSRTTYQVSEQVSRLQENGRYAMSVIEPDLRLGNHWGLMNDPLMANGATKPGDGASPLSGSTGSCGTNFALQLGEFVRGDNNSYTLGPGRTAACNAFNNNPQPSSDTITVRRVSEQPTPVTANTLQLYVTRGFSATQVFRNGIAPGPLPPLGAVDPNINAEIHDVIVDTYYIDRDSVGRIGIPALRRISLVGGAGGPNWSDTEVISGVEDLQVQFGVDLGRDVNNDGVLAGNDEVDEFGFPRSYRGMASQYVNPGAAVLGNGIVVSVRIWLLLRSETPETGFVDLNTYVYGDRLLANGTTATLNAGGAAGKAYRPNDNFRRLLMSRTVQLRNTISVEVNP